MIVIKLATGEDASINKGVWSVPDNPEIERVLNSPAMQPTGEFYAPTADAGKAQHVLKAMGGTFVSTTERWPKGKLY